MALNGFYPLIIFRFTLAPQSDTFNAISGIPVIGEFIAQNIGIPVPIYLDERQSGIVLVSEEKSIDVETTAQAKKTGDKPKTDQRGLNSTVTINMTAISGSVYLTALSALCDLVFQKVISKEYTISYVNGSTAIFDGLLESFTSSVNSDTTKIDLALKISRANQNTTRQAPQIPPLEKTTTAIPGA